MYFDRFDICEAYYVFFCDHHGGQFSREYERLSKMGEYFKPRLSLSFETLTENAQEIYNALCERAGY